MGYYTRLELQWDNTDKRHQPFTLSDANYVITQWLNERSLSNDVLMDWHTLQEEPFGYCFNSLSKNQLIELLEIIASAFPHVHFYARGMGEDFTDVWLREFANGKVIKSIGPFKLDSDSNGQPQKIGWLSKLFSQS
ncbi:MAG: hypothetical protein WBO82_02730 [Neisseria sp.]